MAFYTSETRSYTDERMLIVIIMIGKTRLKKGNRIYSFIKRTLFHRMNLE